MSESITTPAGSPTGTVNPPVPASADAAPDSIQLPDDHPLVKSLAAQKAEIKALKEKAARLDQIEEASKTAEQKAADRAADAELRAAQAEARATRREIALEHKLSREDATLLDSVADEDAMRALAVRLAKQAEDKPKGRNYVPNEGTGQSTTPLDEQRAFVRRLTGRE